MLAMCVKVLQLCIHITVLAIHGYTPNVCSYYYYVHQLLAAFISRIGIHFHFMTCTIGWAWL